MSEALPTLGETKMRDDEGWIEKTRSTCWEMARNSKVPFPEDLWTTLLTEMKELYRRSHLTSSLYNKYEELGCGDLVLLPEEQLSRPWRKRQTLTNEAHLTETEKALCQSILEMGIRPPIRKRAPRRALPNERRMGSGHNPSELFLDRRNLLGTEGLRMDKKTIAAVQEVHAVNLTLLAMSAVHIPKEVPTTLKRFNELQNSCLKSLQVFLKFQWYADIRHILADLFEAHVDFYGDESRKRKLSLLLMVRKMMEATLITVIFNAAEKMLDFVKDSLGEEEGDAVDNVKSARPKQQAFHVEVVLRKGASGSYEACFEPELSSFATSTRSTLENLLELCSTLPCVGES